MKLVIQNGARVWGGNEKWIALVSRGLLERGHEVVVSCVGGSIVEERLRERGVPTTRIRPRGDLDVFSAWRFRRWLRRRRPDTLLLTTWRRFVWGAWAGRVPEVGRVAARLSIVRPLPSSGPLAHVTRSWIERWIVNGPEVREAVLSSAPEVPAERVRLLLNGVRPVEADPAPIRAELGIGPHTRIVLSVGHVTRRKGYHVLVDALADLEPDVHAVVAGSFDDGGEGRQFVERARERGVADRLHWLGFRDDVPALLAAADAVAHPSWNEGMANVMLEAMAAGRPVVAAGVGGVEMALGATADRGPAGWRTEPGDADALAEEIRAAIAEGPDGPRAAEARWRARHWFGVERMIDEVEAILFG